MKKPVALVGATGMVGQSLIALLDKDPEYYIAEICGSEARQGKFYDQEVRWILQGECPTSVRGLVFKNYEEIKSQRVISALPGKAALTIEADLVKKGHLVFSNSAAHRLKKEGFLIVPEVNGALLVEKKDWKGKGWIVTNPNCVVAILSLALAPLFQKNLLTALSLTTLQSVSGAGYPGVASLDIIGNVLPYIEGEEEKIKEELCYLFQKEIPISIQCNRVPTLVGHLVSCEATFSKEMSVEALIEELSIWSHENANGALKICQEREGPQPRKTLHANDMHVYVGRFQKGMGANQLRFVVLGDNLGRGAAGAALANLRLYDCVERGGSK